VPNSVSFFPALLFRGLLAPAIVTLVTTYLIHSTLVMGGTWLAIRAARLGSEALKERLWKLAAIVPLCTAPLQSILHVSPLTVELVRSVAAFQESRVDRAETLASTDVSLTTPLPEMALAEPRTWSEGSFATPARSPGSEPALAESVTEDASSAIQRLSERPSNKTLPLGQVGVGWIAVAIVVICCVGFARLVLQSHLFSRCLRGCAVIRDPAIGRMIADIVRRARVRRGFRLLSSPSFRQPAAFGLFRWTIVLPENALRTFEPNELYALLAHEAAHLVRGDAVWLWIGRTLCSGLPFQPLNFVARRAWRRSAELLCDEWAVNHSAESLALARCLTRVAESTFGSPRLQALWALGAPSHLSERVERLLNGECRGDAWSSRARGQVVALTAAALAMAFMCVAPRTSVMANGSEPTEGIRAGESAPTESAESAFDRHPGIASLGEELRRLKSEIDDLRAVVKSRRATNAPALHLADQIAQRASALQTCYQTVANARQTPATRGKGESQ